MGEQTDDDKNKDKGKQDDDKGGGGSDEGVIRRVVSEVLGDLFKSGKADVDDKGGAAKGRRTADDAGDIGAQVEAAVKKVRSQDAAAKAEEEREARLKALEEKVAKPEKQPKQHRKITRFMWGEDED